MGLKTLDLLKQRSVDKAGKSKYADKRLENLLVIELQEKLGDLLTDNDKVMIEIPAEENVEQAFLNAADRLTSVFIYEQEDLTHYIFTNKEINI